jgi:hypothetical protein
MIELGAACTSSIGCAPATGNDASATPTSPARDHDIEQMRAELEGLGARVDRLERERERRPDEGSAAPAGWSCMAKCGSRSTQTTEFRMEYERVTGHGATAAEAYQHLLDGCRGTIYERLEDERFVGGEMKNVCLDEAAAAR